MKNTIQISFASEKKNAMYMIMGIIIKHAD